MIVIFEGTYFLMNFPWLGWTIDSMASHYVLFILCLFVLLWNQLTCWGLHGGYVDFNQICWIQKVSLIFVGWSLKVVYSLQRSYLIFYFVDGNVVFLPIVEGYLLTYLGTLQVTDQNLITVEVFHWLLDFVQTLITSHVIRWLRPWNRKNPNVISVLLL